MVDKKRLVNPESIRNLTQYRDMSDEEFGKVYEEKYAAIIHNEDFEQKIKEKIDEFSQDWDISDMKINDMLTLRALVQAMITLDELEQYMYTVRSSQGINYSNLAIIEKISNQQSNLRSDISKLQSDLNITRKNRKSDKDASVIAYIDNLKQKAKEFSESKMLYLFCPNCNMLLGTFWGQYKISTDVIKLSCERCKRSEADSYTFKFNIKDLYEKKIDQPTTVPEEMK